MTRTPAEPRRRRLAVLLLGLALPGLALAVQWRRAQTQADAVRGVQRLGGWVFYDCHYAEDGSLAASRPAGPKWVRRTLGMDFMGTVHGVILAGQEPLDGLPTMEMLHHGIPVRDADLAVVRPLTRLEWLALSGTHVTDEGLVHLEGMKNLRWLWLNHTAITDRGVARLKDLPAIERLWLDHTRISSDGLREISGATGLRLLSLRGTDVDDDGLAHLENLRRLETLNLDGTPCSFSAVLRLLVDAQGRGIDEALQVAGAVGARDAAGGIVSLDLTKTELTDADLEIVRQFDQLQWLHLQGTGVSDAGLAHLAGVGSLTLLDLNDTEVTGAGLEYLKGLRNLETLHLERTGVTEEDFDSFRQAMPARLRIYADGAAPATTF